MALCPSDELMAEACLSGFTCLGGDSRLSWAVAVQQLAALSGNTFTVQELLDQAAASGFSTNEHPRLALAMADQQVCNLIG